MGAWRPQEGKALISNGLTGFYSSKKIKPLLSKAVRSFEEKGIAVALSKITVNLGQPVFREFLWVELIDTEVAGSYKPAQAVALS